MVVAFFGTPQFAVPTLRQLLASTHEVRGVVTQPDKPRGRGQKITDAPVKSLALGHGLPVLQPEKLRDAEFVAAFRSWNADLGVVVAYGKMLPDAVLRIPRLGMINVHASLLPKYRGAAPVHRAVIDGERETGVTIMRVGTTLDAGDMLAQVRRPIGPNETSDEIERDLADIGARLLVDVVDQMERGEVIGEPQDGAASTYASKLTKEEGLIDWALPSTVLHDRVRGLCPWPHAYTYLNGARLILLKTRITDERTAHRPGTVVEAANDGIKVAAGDGRVIAIDELQPEGRRAMRAREYLSGRPLAPGAVFSRQ
jgi:methionyl-tRNA formyltransferase